VADVEALFSPNQNKHVLLNSESFVSSTINGISYRDAVQSWLFAGEDLVLIAE
jgi:hypothetical protein